MPEIKANESLLQCYADICEQLLDQYNSKNTAYGNNMSKNFRKYGEVVYALRISDKLGRLKTLRENHDISRGDESILDTIGDAITYCLMCSGDIAAKAAIADKDSIMNMTFTRELFCDLIQNPFIVQEVIASIDGHINDYTEWLDCSYENGTMGVGCYRLAMMLLHEYVRESNMIAKAENRIHG